jgi:DNA-directed RNA polymerase subunit H
MVVDILKHKLVDRHEILSLKEKKSVLEEFDIEKEKLPVILLSDPIAKEIEAKKGDIIRITRNSPTAVESIYYRQVV